MIHTERLTVPDRRPWTRPLRRGALLLLLALAAWLRWRYITGVGIHVDEFSTLWAADRVLATGAPLMPSGVLYTRGLFSTYLIALAMRLGGESYLIARFSSLLFGLATVAALYVVGARGWNRRVGWLAALGLVLLSESIEASGRARFYAPLLFWVLLAFWMMFAIVSEEPEQQRHPLRSHLLFFLFFVLALFSQEQTILLYPALLLSALLWRGWRYFFTPAAWITHGLCMAAIAARFVIERLGQPGYFDAMQVDSPYLALTFALGNAWRAVDEIFVAPSRLPWSIFALVALVAALWRWRSAHWRLTDLPRAQQATLFFALQAAALLAIFLTLVGPSWHHPRYVLIIEPVWLLLGAAGMVWTIDRLLISERLRWLAIGAATMLLLLAMWPDAEQETRREMLGYETAFAVVAAQRQPGDVVISPQAAGCAFVLRSPCDYYAAGNDFAPYVIPRRPGSTELVDRWTGAALLQSAAELTTVLQNSDRVWLITDGDRLLHRFASDFSELVIEQFELVSAERKVAVLLATGWRAAPVSTVVAEAWQPKQLAGLTLDEWTMSSPSGGAELAVRLRWTVPADEESVHSSVRVVDAVGAVIAQADGPLAGGVISAGEAEGDSLPDIKRLALPALAPGRYRIDVVAYDGLSGEIFGEPVSIAWFRSGEPVQPPTASIDADWQAGLNLVGMELPQAASAGDPLAIRLVWKTDKPVLDDYTVFVHLIGPDGTIVSQHDAAPEQGFYPTSGWRTGDLVEDHHRLTLPADTPPGVYRLRIGWYAPATGERLRLGDGTEALDLPCCTVTAAR